MSTTSTMDEKSQQNLRESWERTQSGANSGRTAFLFGDWKYQQLSLSPEESQFLGTRKMQLTEIAALFRVPSHMVGDTSRLSNSNHEQMSLGFVTDTLRPYLCRFEHEIIRKLLPTTGRNSGRYMVSYDVRERLRGDFATTQAGFQTGVLSGWLSRNDVRRELGENPGLASLDVYMVPVNMQHSDRLLDTESVQDQPVDADPNAQDDAPPTQQERSALKQYRTAYLRLFSDALSRVLLRPSDKRSIATITGAFDPLLHSIADLSGSEARSIAGVPGWQFDPDKTIAAHLKAMAERAKGWKVEDRDAITGQELTRAVRALVFAANRAAGEARAEQTFEEVEQ